MKKEKIMDLIFSHKSLKEKPPVLFDVGSSGHLHKDWKDIAKYSICIAFDADDREMGYIEKKSKDYKKLYVYNCILVSNDTKEDEFFLTRSPFCSSLLEPDLESLKNWSFHDLFIIEKKEKLKTVNIPQVMNELKIDRIDWFKADSQGTDLRLFKSIGDKMKLTLAADFEPGIIDAYKGEDKLWNVLEFMDKQQFWVCDLNIPRAAVRIDKRVMNDNLKSEQLKYVNEVLTRSPTCGEITYFNSFENREFVLRDYLLMIAFSLIKDQLGFALELSARTRIFNDEILFEIENFILKEISLKVDKEKRKKSNLFKILTFPYRCIRYVCKILAAL